MPQGFRFEGFTLDGARGCLRRDGRAIELRPKVFGVLVHLVENAGRLVGKDDIVAAVWPDVVVTDESLAKCISEVRAALGEAGPRLIKTVPRRGYLFDAPVFPADDGSASCEVAAPAEAAWVAVGSSPARRAAWHPRLGAAALVLVAAAVAATLFFRLAPAPPLPDRPSLAVLPVINESGDPQQQYFSDGLTEDLIVTLGKFSSLFVIGRDSAFVYKGRTVPARVIGRELGVRYLVQGSVRRAENQVRITAELIDAASGRQIWAESYDRTPADIFAIQDELTRKVVGTLVAQVDRSELGRALRKPPESLDAYDWYLRGNALLRARHGPDRGEMVLKARRLFGKAVDASPDYAPAVEGLAYTYAVGFLERTDYGPLGLELGRQATLDTALALAQRAVELDPYRAEAHATLAWILHWSYRRDEALEEFERALQLNPNLADGRFAHMLVHDGRAAEAVEFMKRIMRQDPFPPPIYMSYLGNAYYLTGRYKLALQSLKAGCERLPSYRPLVVWAAAAAAQLGRGDEARAGVAAVLKTAPDFTIGAWLRHIRFANQADADRLAEGMRKAGFPN